MLNRVIVGYITTVILILFKSLVTANGALFVPW